MERRKDHGKFKFKLPRVAKLNNSPKPESRNEKSLLEKKNVKNNANKKKFRVAK